MNQNDKQLNILANELNANPSLKITLIGHTDNSGPESLNNRLSKSRASKVYEFLTSKGVSSSQIITKGLGESSPKYPNDSEESKSKNRRVEIKF